MLVCEKATAFARATFGRAGLVLVEEESGDGRLTGDVAVFDEVNADLTDGGLGNGFLIEGGHDAELATAAVERPEEVGVSLLWSACATTGGVFRHVLIVLCHHDLLSRGQHHVHGE